MANFASSFAAQIGVGFISFAVSALCIVSAAGPVHVLG